MNETTTAIRSDDRVLLPSVMEFLHNSPRKLLIGGKWVPAQSGKAFETINPANEEVLALYGCTSGGTHWSDCTREFQVPF